MKRLNMTFKRTTLSSGLVALMTVSGLAHGVSDPAQDTSGDADLQWLQQSLNEVILPAFADFAAQTQSLHGMAESVCASDRGVDMAGLTRLRAAWREAGDAWAKAEMYPFGPTVADFRDFEVNFWPTKKAKVKAVLKGEGALSTEDVTKLGVGARGLPAMEYLLFDASQYGIRKPGPEADQALLTRFAPSKEGHNRGCAYLSTLSGMVADTAATMQKEWSAGFKTQLLNPGSGDYASYHQVLEQLINSLIESTDKIAISKLGNPSGAQGNKKPRPYKAEAWRSRDSLARIEAGIGEIQALGVVLAKHLKVSGHQPAARALKVAIDEAEQAVAAVPGDLFASVTEHNEAVRKVWVSVQAIVRVLKADVADALDVQLGFNGNDGD